MSEKEGKTGKSVENLVRQMDLPWVDPDYVDHLSSECQALYFHEQLEQVITLLIIEYERLRKVLGDISRNPTADRCFNSTSLEEQVEILIKAFSNLEIGFHSFLDEPTIIRAQQALWERGIVGVDPSSEEAVKVQRERDQELECGLTKIWVALRLLGKHRPLGRPMKFGTSLSRGL